MKMKNMLIGGMSLALVACISIGGTLAYLQATDGAVRNSFTFGGNITVDLYEQILDESVKHKIGVGNAEGTGTFGNIVAGVDYKKDVDVTVTAGTDAYVFLRISNDANLENEDVVMTLNNLNGVTWTALDDKAVDGKGYGIYYMEADANTYKNGSTVAVFDSVKLDDSNGQVDIGENGKVADIVLQVGAIQTIGANGEKMTPVEAYNLAKDQHVFDWSYTPEVTPAP